MDLHVVVESHVGSSSSSNSSISGRNTSSTYVNSPSTTAAKSGASRRAEIEQQNEAEASRIAKFKRDTIARIAKWNARNHSAVNDTQKQPSRQRPPPTSERAVASPHEETKDKNYQSIARLNLLRFAGSHAYAESMVERHGVGWRPTLASGEAQSRPSTSDGGGSKNRNKLVMETSALPKRLQISVSKTRASKASQPMSPSNRVVAGSQTVHRREMLVERLVVQMKQQQDKRREQSNRNTTRAVRARLDRQIAQEQEVRDVETRKENESQAGPLAKRQAQAAAESLNRHRAKTESERYISALQERLRQQVQSKNSNAQVPALCPCDRQRQEDGRAVLGPVWEKCATNCPFHHNPKAFAGALRDLANSLEAM